MQDKTTGLMYYICQKKKKKSGERFFALNIRCAMKFIVKLISNRTDMTTSETGRRFILVSQSVIYIIYISYVLLNAVIKSERKVFCRIIKEDIICKEKTCLASVRNLPATPLCFPLFKPPGSMNMYDM